jgi:hypothetical protein
MSIWRTITETFVDPFALALRDWGSEITNTIAKVCTAALSCIVNSPLGMLYHSLRALCSDDTKLSSEATNNMVNSVTNNKNYLTISTNFYNNLIQTTNSLPRSINVTWEELSEIGNKGAEIEYITEQHYPEAIAMCIFVALTKSMPPGKSISLIELKNESNPDKGTFKVGISTSLTQA